MSTLIAKGKKKLTKVYNQSVHRWKSPFIKVEIPSSVDDILQNAWYYKPPHREKSPLIVSLHSWAGTFDQIDPELSREAVNSNWNYIHPDFRGVNNTPYACGSDISMSDIDDAITFAIDNGNVDLDNIFIVGSSGGAYSALCYYSKSRHPINAFIVWSPITDLLAWYNQSIIRKTRYAQDIMNGTNSTDALDIKEAKKRSPLYRDLPNNNSKLYIFTGYHDGYEIKAENPVPITHSLKYFNMYSMHHGATSDHLISNDEIIKLTTREMPKTNETISDRKVVYSKSYKNASITIFDGGHEHLDDHNIKLIKENLL